MRLSLVVLIALFFIVQIGGLIWYFQDELRESGMDVAEIGLIDSTTPVKPRASMPGGPITESDAPKLGHELLKGMVVLPEGLRPGAVEVIAEQRPIVPEQVLNSHHRRPRWRTALDAESRFRFESLEPGSYVVLAQSRDFHSATIVHLAAQRVHPTAILVLSESRQLRGRVLAPTGAPLPRANVYPVPATTADELPVTWPYAWRPEESDLSGYFNFDHLPEGPLRFLVVHPNFANHLTAPIDNFAADLEVTLHEGLETTLVLQNPRGNITRTKVRLTELALGVESHAAHTGPGGVVTFSKLRPVRYRVTVESDRYALDGGAFPLTVAPHPSGPHEAAVIRGGTIRGQVLSRQTDTGIQDVPVDIHGPHAPDVLSVNTDRGGYYRFAGLTPGRYRVAVRPGRTLLVDGPGEAEVDVQQNDRSQGPVFVLKPGIPLKGVVKTLEGTTVPHAEVFLHLAGNDAIDRAIRSNGQGVFSFEGIAEDTTLRIWARAGEQISPAFGPADPGPEGLPNIVLTIAFSTSAMIRGEVVDHDGAPVAQAAVRLEGPEKVVPVARETASDAWGAFRFEGLAPGDYRVSVRTEDGEEGEQRVESVRLEDGKTVVLELRLP